MTPETTFLLQDIALYGAMTMFAIGAFVTALLIMQAKYGSK